MAKKTKVLYDTDQAIDQLEKLDKQTKKSGRTAEESFGKADGASKALERQLGKIPGTAGRTVSEFRAVAAAGGAAGVAVTGLALSAGALVSQILDLPTLLLNTNRQLQELSESTRAAQAFADAASDIGDALEKRGFFEARQQLDFTQAGISEAQIENNNAKLAAQERLRIESEKFRTIDAEAKRSTRERLTAEKELQNKLRELAVDTVGAGTTPGRAVGDLASAAQRAARQGDTQRAEELIDRAKELSAELGNHVFFTRQIDSANQAVVRALQERVAEEKRAEATNQASAATQRQRLELAKEQRREATAQSVELQNQSKQLRADRRINRVLTQQFGDTELAEQAGRDLRTARIEIENIERSGLSLGDTFRTFGGLLLDATKESDSLQASIKEFIRIADSSSIRENVLTGTPASLQLANEQASRLREILGGLQADPNFAENTLAVPLERIEAVLQAVERAGTAGQRGAAAGVQADEQIDAGAERLRFRTELQKLDNLIIEDQKRLAERAALVADEYERAAVAAQRLEDNTSQVNLPNVPQPGFQPEAQGADTGGAAPATVNQNINVNATVRGGIIDRETTEQIIDIVNREVRKLTTQGVN